MPIDARCVQLASNGDRGSQKIIYEAMVERVYRLVLRIVGVTDAEDVTQNVFIQLFSKLRTFRHESEFSTWVHRLAVNEALQHKRRLQREETFLLTSHDGMQRDGSQATEWKELWDVALSRLDSELRLILELKELEEMSYSQIAETIGIPEGTVGSRLNRARRELRDQLTALGWEGME